MKTTLGQQSKLLIKYLGPQWQQVLALSALMLAGIALQLVNPRILGRFIDAAQARAPARDLVTNAAAFLIAAIIGQAATLAVTYLSSNVGWRATNRLRTDLAAHVLSLDISFHKAHTPGDLIERIDGDVGMLARFFSRMVIDMLGNTLLGIGVLGALFLADRRVGLIGVAYAVLVMVVMRVLQQPATQAFAHIREAEAELFGFMGEHLYGMEDIRSSGAEAYAMRGLHHRTAPVSQDRLRLSVVRSLQSNLGSLVFAVAQVLALALSAWMLTRGETTLGTVFVTLNYIALLKQPVNRIQRQAGDLQGATAGIQRINALLNTTPRITSTGRLKLPAGPLSVAFSNVGFRYNHATEDVAGDVPTADSASELLQDNGWALQELSFKLSPGRVLGLLGRTGSGKTTMTRLLFRLYDPDDGAILYSNVDLRDIHLDSIRRRIGLVTQEVQIFRASVRDNLALFNPDIPDAHLLAALQTLRLEPWIASLPEGLDTVLQPGTEGLSAGEAQLLDLARVFLRDPDIVILDEASARLDPVTEHLLNTAIAGLITDRTAIIIAHRLSTIQRADDIMILDHGACVEFGERLSLAADPDSRFSHLLRTGLQEVLV